MVWMEEYTEHRCEFPSDAPRSERKEYWECPECLTIYRVSHTGWTGFWSPDSSDSVRGKTADGYPSIYCMYETWKTCPPSIKFTPVRWGVYGDQKCSGYGMQDDDPGEKPQWIIDKEQEPPRPLWAGKDIPGGTTRDVDNSPLSRVPSPTDDDLPKKRSWFTKG